MDGHPEELHAQVEAEALDHAVRMWEAEQELARRLASRSNSILTLIVAVLGYGIWNLTALGTVEPPGVRTAMRALLTLSLVLLLAALGVLLFPTGRQVRGPRTSTRLDVDRGRIPSRMTRAKYLALARHRVVQSGSAQGKQNAWNQARAAEAQTLMFSASLCAGAAVICYFCFAI